jgi:hypothetical protein
MYMQIAAPVLTSLLLAMALFPRKGRTGRKVLFHIVAIPILYGLIVIVFRYIPYPWSCLFFYTCFVLFMYLYLITVRVIRKYRDR